MLTILTARGGRGGDSARATSRGGGSSRRGVSATGDDRSYQMESAIFGEAGVDSSSIDNRNEEDDDSLAQPTRDLLRYQRLEKERIAREQGERAPPTFWSRTKTFIISGGKSFLSTVWEM